MAKVKANKPSFEESLQQLEVLVESMESGDIPLCSLVSNYEKGSKLLAQCQQELQAAVLRVEQVTSAANQEPVLESFESE